jgi:hypothetical protein
MTQHYATLQRNLLYTGVTRGKRLVVLVGQKKAIAIAAELVEVGGMAERAGLEAWRECMMASVTEPPWPVAVLFGDQENTKQVNCVVSSMHHAWPLCPQLLTYRCGAANRRFGPIRGISHCEKQPNCAARFSVT